MKAEISVLDGDSEGEVLQLAGPGSYTIGRGTKSDLKIGDRNVSRQHCRIDYDGEFFWLIDSQSANGTVVNQRTIQKYLLFDGDVIEVGKTRLVFRLKSEKPS